jgi:hypothetical protein
MAYPYYYATARVYVSTNNRGLSSSDLANNLVTSNPVIVSDAKGDGVSGKQYAWYVIDVYNSDVSDFKTWAALPASNRGNLITCGKKATDALTVTVGSTPNVSIGQPLCIDSHLEITVSNKVVGSPRSFTPTVTVQAPDLVGGTGSADITLSSGNILWLNTSKKAPTIKFTAVAGQPTYPETAVATWLKSQKAAGVFVPLATISAKGEWSICNKKWCFFVDEPSDVHPMVVSFWSCDENGTTFTSETGQKPKDWPVPSYPKINMWNSQSLAKYKKAMDASACKGNNTTTGGGDPAPDLPVAPPTDDTRWNPPPHVYSRSVPYGIFKKYTDPNAFNDNYARATLEASEYSALKRAIQAQGSDVAPSPEYSYLQRGRIFQDLNSASVLNSANANAVAGKPSASSAAKQWGFRFMYNPTTISYQTSASNAVDWTFGSKDSAALLTGNQTVTIQLYLNRIIDLGYLNAVYGYGYLNSLGANQISIPAAYGRNLTPDEYKGIMSRGTEYDLEFLYRCLTGDPLTNNPLLNSDFKTTGSADIGYITGIPLWLYLNDNLRYFGSVASLNVNHVIFNTEMVPMLSVVDINFSRYPAYGINDTTKYSAAINDASKQPAAGPTNP